MLERAVRSVVGEIELRIAAPHEIRSIRWGRETEVVQLDSVDVGRAAGYIAKYATKATEGVAGGVLIPRVRSEREVAALQAPQHAKHLVAAAWRVRRVPGLERACRWSHQFGYGGHTLTKSRDYSVTFTALRAARAAWRAGRPSNRWTFTITRGTLVYAGRGYVSRRAAWLAGACRSDDPEMQWRPERSEGVGGRSS